MAILNVDHDDDENHEGKPFITTLRNTPHKKGGITERQGDIVRGTDGRVISRTPHSIMRPILGCVEQYGNSFLLTAKKTTIPAAGARLEHNLIHVGMADIAERVFAMLSVESDCWMMGLLVMSLSIDIVVNDAVNGRSWCACS